MKLYLEQSKQKIMNLRSVPRLEPIYRHRTLWMKRNLDPLEEASASPPKMYIPNLSPQSSPKESVSIYQGGSKFGKGE